MDVVTAVSPIRTAAKFAYATNGKYNLTLQGYLSSGYLLVIIIISKVKRSFKK